MSEPFPIWITKWCLSQGIEEATAYEFPGVPEWCIVASGRLKNCTNLTENQWHRTRADAVKEARAVLARTIKSQRERLEELESVVFTLEDGDESTGNSPRESAGGNQSGIEG